MNAVAQTETLSRSYCVLFAITSGAAISAAASSLGSQGFFLPYLTMLAWSAIPFAVSRKIFRSKERSWLILIAYVAFGLMATILYPAGILIPFIGWPLLYALRGRCLPWLSPATVGVVDAKPSQVARLLVVAITLSFMVPLAMMIAGLWWATFSTRDVRNNVAAFCASVNVGDPTMGLDKKANVALQGSYKWSHMPNGEMELVVDKYTAFTRSICTISAASGKVISKKKWGYAL